MSWPPLTPIIISSLWLEENVDIVLLEFEISIASIFTTKNLLNVSNDTSICATAEASKPPTNSIASWKLGDTSRAADTSKSWNSNTWPLSTLSSFLI